MVYRNVNYDVHVVSYSMSIQVACNRCFYFSVFICYLIWQYRFICILFWFLISFLSSYISFHDICYSEYIHQGSAETNAWRYQLQIWVLWSSASHSGQGDRPTDNRWYVSLFVVLRRSLEFESSEDYSGKQLGKTLI